MKTFNKLDSFHLKLIALLTMCIDHIGAYLLPYSQVQLIFRAIGRISFPLFAFMVSEGIYHSKKPINYILRLFTLGIIMDLADIIVLKAYSGNTLMTFFIAATTLYLLRIDNKKLRFLSIIPFSIGILSGFNFFPIRLEYGPYGFILVLLFAASRYLYNYISNKANLKFNNTYFQMIIASSIFIIYSTICYFFQRELYLIFNASNVNYRFQTFGLIGIIPLLLYSGKRGYNAKWFQWGCYLFFPLHLIILYFIKHLIGI